MWMTNDLDSMNWVTLTFLFLFGLLAFSYRLHPNQTQLFIKIFDFSTYLKVYREKTELIQSIRFHRKINVFSTLSCSLLIAFILDYYELFPFDEIHFLKLYGGIVAIVSVRHLVVQFLAQLIGIQKQFKILAFYNSALMGVFGLFSFGTAVLYAFVPKVFFELLFPYLFFPLAGMFFIFQLIALGGIYKRNFRTSVYLFLYFCAFKITPWIWMAVALQILNMNGPIFEL